MNDLISLNMMELIFVCTWAFIGSILGFYSFRYNTGKSFAQNLPSCFLSIGIGIFVAFPLCVYFIDHKGFSRQLSILLCGLGSFGIPDLVLKWYPKLQRIFLHFLMDRYHMEDVDLGAHRRKR